MSRWNHCNWICNNCKDFPLLTSDKVNLLHQIIMLKHPSRHQYWFRVRILSRDVMQKSLWITSYILTLRSRYDIVMVVCGTFSNTRSEYLEARFYHICQIKGWSLKSQMFWTCFHTSKYNTYITKSPKMQVQKSYTIITTKQINTAKA